MKKGLLLAVCATIGFAGCTTHDYGSGGVGPAFETSAGRGYTMENDLGISQDPRGGWENWRFGGDPDRIPPRLPLNPRYPATFPQTTAE
jgi:hypothetical protein